MSFDQVLPTAPPTARTNVREIAIDFVRAL